MCICMHIYCVFEHTNASAYICIFQFCRSPAAACTCQLQALPVPFLFHFTATALYQQFIARKHTHHSHQRRSWRLTVPKYGVHYIENFLANQLHHLVRSIKSDIMLACNETINEKLENIVYIQNMPSLKNHKKNQISHIQIWQARLASILSTFAAVFTMTFRFPIIGASTGPQVLDNRGKHRPNYVAPLVFKPPSSVIADYEKSPINLKRNHWHSIEKHLDSLSVSLVARKLSAFLPLLCAGRAPSTVNGIVQTCTVLSMVNGIVQTCAVLPSKNAFRLYIIFCFLANCVRPGAEASTC